MVILITLEEAKDHLRMTMHDLDDADIQRKCDQASDIIMDYLKRRDIPDAWQEGTAFSPPGSGIPGTVKAAALLALSELYENRNASAADVLSDSVKALLNRWRIPVAM